MHILYIYKLGGRPGVTNKVWEHEIKINFRISTRAISRLFGLPFSI